jgi:hypothetical protein
MDYVLKIETYGDNSIRLELPVNWEVGIEQAFQISKQFESKRWTRHSSVGGPINGCGLYADLYNEGSVMLITKKQYDEEFKK